MRKKLPELHHSEFKKKPFYAKVWSKASAEWEKDKFWQSQLQQDQAIAIRAYTMEDLYNEFNAAVREAGKSRQEYQDKFHFKGTCLRVYRGVDGTRLTTKCGQTVRFGQFTSSSVKKEVAKKFGTDTFFEVETCHGAKIQGFSHYPTEQEVLIPPFETFDVIRAGESTGTLCTSLGSS
ncbi:PREDICTED: NAD(P)(+)--arginine ADP-ribosyltransferase 2-like [Acanthisitta chloris]|uniref:NAD(P)(+)--arginine ADP-ribosyltransferase 2-like n=1 Tax=Acanthisitta chloris TaxID=57068 RepID=UPI0004F0EC71|nr:PREDICTED: NAD(P)(+)--arginine ADP-ribosyltransferase 2-like [Acanthisitta chloris]